LQFKVDDRRIAPEDEEFAFETLQKTNKNRLALKDKPVYLFVSDVSHADIVY